MKKLRMYIVQKLNAVALDEFWIVRMPTGFCNGSSDVKYGGCPDLLTM